jgi:hypothetical protein
MYTMMPHGPMCPLGYILTHNEVYLVDKTVDPHAYGISPSIVGYQTAVFRGDMDATSKLLPEIPARHKNRVDRFLELQGKPVSTIPRNNSEPFWT